MAEDRNIKIILVRGMILAKRLRNGKNKIHARNQETRSRQATHPLGQLGRQPVRLRARGTRPREGDPGESTSRIWAGGGVCTSGAAAGPDGVTISPPGPRTERADNSADNSGATVPDWSDGSYPVMIAHVVGLAGEHSQVMGLVVVIVPVLMMHHVMGL